MRIFPKRKTDDELVEELRKAHRNRWKTAIPLAVLFFAMSIIIFLGGFFFEQKWMGVIKKQSTAKDFNIDKSNEAISALVGFKIGILCGGGIPLFGIGMMFLIDASIRGRRNALLLKLYDERNQTQP